MLKGSRKYDHFRYRWYSSLLNYPTLRVNDILLTGIILPIRALPPIFGCVKSGNELNHEKVSGTTTQR
jgi:hypothetical protein